MISLSRILTKTIICKLLWLPEMDYSWKRSLMIDTMISRPLIMTLCFKEFVKLKKCKLLEKISSLTSHLENLKTDLLHAGCPGSMTIELITTLIISH